MKKELVGVNCCLLFLYDVVIKEEIEERRNKEDLLDLVVFFFGFL